MGCGPSLQPKKVASLQTLLQPTPDELVLTRSSRGAKPKISSGAKEAYKTENVLQGYALFFAVDTYTYLTPLSAAVSDADAMAKCLTNLGFKVVLKLYNNACTLPVLQQKLRESCNQIATNAKVLIFFAGHGLRHAVTGRTFYCTVNTEQSRLLSTAFDLETIFTLMDFMPKHQAWVMDFCFSGGACMSTVRRGYDIDSDESPSISVVTAGRSGESVVESELVETPTCSPLRTPQGTPNASPRHAEGGQVFFSNEMNHRPLPIPKFHSVPVRKTKGLFSHCLVRELKKVYAKQRHQGKSAKVSLTQLFVAVRCEVQRQSRRLGIRQTPQLSRIHWYRQKKAEGEFFF